MAEARVLMPGNGGLGFDSGEGAWETATASYILAIFYPPLK